MSKATRQRFTSAFREAAVRSVEQGEKIADAAQRLEMSEKTLSNWVYAARNGNAPAATAPAPEPAAYKPTPAPTPKGGMSVNEMEMELYKLRSENTQLKIDKEILKKAAAFFVKESR